MSTEFDSEGAEGVEKTSTVYMLRQQERSVFQREYSIQVLCPQIYNQRDNITKPNIARVVRLVLNKEKDKNSPPCQGIRHLTHTQQHSIFAGALT